MEIANIKKNLIINCNICVNIIKSGIIHQYFYFIKKFNN